MISPPWRTSAMAGHELDHDPSPMEHPYGGSVPRFWNLYKPERGKPGIGDTVRLNGKTYTITGIAGADSEGTPYVHLAPAEANGKPIVRLVTSVARA